VLIAFVPASCGRGHEGVIIEVMNEQR